MNKNNYHLIDINGISCTVIETTDHELFKRVNLGTRKRVGGVSFPILFLILTRLDTLETQVDPLKWDDEWVKSAHMELYTSWDRIKDKDQSIKLKLEIM